MLKKHSQFFETLFITFDIIIVMVAWVLSYFQRFYLPIVPITKGIPPFVEYIKSMALIPFIWIPVYLNLGLYRSRRLSKWYDELYDVTKASSLAIIIYISVLYIFRHYEMSRGVFLTFWVLHIIMVWGGRRTIRWILKYIRKKGYNIKRVLIVGAGELGRKVNQIFSLRPELGYKVVGFLTRHKEKVGKEIDGIPVIGMYSDLSKILETENIDNVILAIPFEEQSSLPQLLSATEGIPADVKLVPDYFPFFQLKGGFEIFEGLPFVNLRTTPLVGWNWFLKRTFDITVALISLILSAPLMLIIALLIKLTSKGPVIYKQERVGWDGRRFIMYKFRTMVEDAEKNGPVWSTPNDPRCTPIGKWLRKFSLDELPQLWNVIKGEMSIVGPRPERPFFVEEFKKKIPNYILRLKVKAGITGWAQVNGLRGDTPLDERIKYDLFYIENWSLLFDIKVVLLTLFKGMLNRSA